MGLCFCLPFLSEPSKPPSPPPPPEHVAHVPIVPEPSVRKGMAGCGAGTNGAHALAFTEAPLRLVLGACNIPHPQKVSPCGKRMFCRALIGGNSLGEGA